MRCVITSYSIHYTKLYELVDHNPLGKRKELVESLKLSQEFDTKWFLGLRAVIGTQEDFWSDAYAEIFQQYYSDIFWYGDAAVITDSQLSKINTHFNCQAKEMGYVSRLYESRILQPAQQKRLTGLVSVPWFSEHSRNFSYNFV